MARARRRAVRDAWSVIRPLMWIEQHATETAFFLAPVAARAAWVAALCVLQLAVAISALIFVGSATAVDLARRYRIDEHLGNKGAFISAFWAEHTRAGALASARNLRTLAAARCGLVSNTIFTATSSSLAEIERKSSCVLFTASCAFADAVHIAGTTASALAAAPAHAAARISRSLRAILRISTRVPSAGGAAILRQLFPATAVSAPWTVSVIHVTRRLRSLPSLQIASLAGRLLGRLGAAGVAAACFVTQPCAARMCPLVTTPLSSTFNACSMADSRAAPPRARSTWRRCCAHRAAAARVEDDYTLFRLMQPP